MVYNIHTHSEQKQKGVKEEAKNFARMLLFLLYIVNQYFCDF